MERTDPMVLDNWRPKKKRFLVIKKNKLHFVEPRRVGKWPVVGIYTKYNSSGYIKSELEIYKFGNSLQMICHPMASSALRPIIEKLPDGQLESIQIQFGGKAYDLLNDEGISFEVTGGKLIIRLFSVHAVMKKFAI